MATLLFAFARCAAGAGAAIRHSTARGPRGPQRSLTRRRRGRVEHNCVHKQLGFYTAMHGPSILYPDATNAWKRDTAHAHAHAFIQKAGAGGFLALLGLLGLALPTHLPRAPPLT